MIFEAGILAVVRRYESIHDRLSLNLSYRLSGTRAQVRTLSIMSSSTPPYLNPIIPGFNPDPTIIRVNSSYFLATSTFEYFPGVPIYHSTDLLNWTLIGHALTRPSQLGMRSVEPGGGIFAPTLRWWKGRFYMCVCVVHQLSWDNVSVSRRREGGRASGIVLSLICGG